MEKKNILLATNAFALAITLFVNYLSNTGLINDNTVARVSERNQNLFTPAGYAFSIWGLIYMGLLVFVVYLISIRKSKGKDTDLIWKVGYLFILSCVFNCLWLFAWLYEFIGLSVLIMSALLFCLLRILFRLNINMYPVSAPRLVCVFWPFEIYCGWITIALIANVAAWLTHLNWNGWGFPDTGWAILIMGIAGFVNVYVTWRRNLKLFSLVGIWALIAIAVRNWNSSPAVSITAVTVSVILLANVVGHTLTSQNNSLKKYMIDKI